MKEIIVVYLQSNGLFTLVDKKFENEFNNLSIKDLQNKISWIGGREDV